MRREPSAPTGELLEVWRLMMGLARARQRVAVEAQRRRLVRELVANETRRREGK